MAGTSLKATIITQAIAAAVFVGLPILITLMAPFTHLEFERTGATARVTVTRYVLVFIPWQTRRVDGVRELRADITSRHRYADTSENRRKGRVGTVNLATGQLALVSGGPDVIVQAAPPLAREAEVRFNRFLAAANPAPEPVSLYASWWLSYVLGGVATAFAALYLVGSAITIARLPFRK